MNAEALCNVLHITDVQVANNLASRFGGSYPFLKDEASNLKQLKNPRSDFVIPVFVTYLKHFSIEVLGVPSLGQADQLRYTDAYSDILSYTDLHFILSHICKHNFFNDFSMSDLTNPVPKRTLALVGVIENFASYYDMKMDDFQPLFDDIDQSKSMYLAMQKRKEELRDQVNNLGKVRFNRTRRTEELEAKMQEKALSIKTLQAKHKDISNEVSQDEGKLHDRKHDADKLKDGNIKLNDALKELQKRVVPSPAQLKSDQHRHVEQLAALNKEVLAQKCLLEGKKSQMVMLEKLRSGQEERGKRLEEVQALRGEVTDVERKGAALEKEKRALTLSCESCREATAKHSSELKDLEHQLLTLQIQGENVLAAKTTALQELKQEKLQAESNRQQKHQQQADLEDKMAAVKRETDEWEAARTEAIEVINDNEERTYNKAESTIISAENALKQEIAELEKKTNDMKKMAKKGRK